MTPPTLNLRYRIFTALARLDVRRPWLVIALSLTLAAACVFYTKSRLQFNTGQDDLISANNRDSRNYLRYTKEFPDLDGLIVVVKVDGNPVRAERFADTLARRLTADHVNVKSVFYRINARQMGNSALLFLSDADLTKLRVHIKANLPMLQAYGANPTLATLFGIVNAQLDHATSSITSGDANGAAATPGMDLKLLDSILIGMNAASNAVTPSPWNSLNPIGQQSGVMGDGYLASDNGKYLLMQIAPGDGGADGPNAVEVIQGQVDAVFDVAGKGALPDSIVLRGGTDRIITISDPAAGKLGVTFSAGTPKDWSTGDLARLAELAARGDLITTVAGTGCPAPTTAAPPPNPAPICAATPVSVDAVLEQMADWAHPGSSGPVSDGGLAFGPRRGPVRRQASHHAGLGGTCCWRSPIPGSREPR